MIFARETTVMEAGIPIFHLASHARAGETLVLKLLNAHPRVFVPLQVLKEEASHDQALVEEVRESGIQRMDIHHEYAQARKLRLGQIIVIKQGIWLHTYPFRGVCLVRNPLSFVDSMMTYNAKEGLGGGLLTYGRKRYQKTFLRLLRWSRDMSEELYQEIDEQRSVIIALCCFYRSRIATLNGYNKSVVKYEDIVTSPVTAMTTICNAFDIEFKHLMLKAHHSYPSDMIGHGMNDLSREIDTASLEKWRSGDRSVHKVVINETLEAAKSVGYTFEEPYLSGL